MLRECTINDLDQTVELVYRKNSLPESSSAFCSKSYDAIKSDFVELLKSEDNCVVGNFKDALLSGVVALFIDRERQSADCIGPFVEMDYLNEAQAMLKFGLERIVKDSTVNFFFDKRNSETLLLMEKMNAVDKGNEQVLILKRSKYTKQEFTTSVIKYNQDVRQQLIDLHDSIFPEAYISGDAIIESIGNNRDVFIVVDEDVLLGYGVLKKHKDSNKTTAEVIAVAPTCRGKGFGRAILGSIIHESFNNLDASEVILVVENANVNALELYFSFNFELQVENCSFQLIK